VAAEGTLLGFRRRAFGRSVAGVAMAVCALAGGMAAASDPVVAQEPVTLRIGQGELATRTGINPFLANLGPDYRLLTDVYDLLVEFGPDLEPAPGLAESWETSPDGLEWTFHIREGATWQDEEPVTADDVAFTIEYILNSQNPDYRGPAAPQGNDEDGNGRADNPLTLYNIYLGLDEGYENTPIESISAPDANTVVIELSEPLIIIQSMWIPIVPEHVWSEIPYSVSSSEVAVEQPIGSGPFILRDFGPDTFTRLEANENYWGGVPKIDELIYQYFENDEAGVAALQSGEIDILLDVSPTLVETLQADPNVTVNVAPTSDLGHLGFNSWNPTPQRFEEEGCDDCPRGPTTGSLGDPWLTNARVRAALAQLINKQEVVDRAWNGLNPPAVSIVGPTTPPYHFEQPADNPATYPGSREEAEARFRQVMEDQGFADTDNNGILNVPDTPEARAFDPEGAGQDWSLRLAVIDDAQEDRIAGELIEAWLESAGVTVDLQPVKEDPELFDITLPANTNADSDMWIWSWGPDPDPQFILGVLTCDAINGWSDSNYCNPEYDRLFQAQQSALDREERLRIILSMQELVYTEAPYAVLWYTSDIEAYRSDRWKGLEPFPEGGGSIWNTDGWGVYGQRLTVAAKRASEQSSGGGSSTAVTVLIVIAALGVIAIVLLFRRRARTLREE
jgi:peptide/nickel transport system substrate-binding protein